MSVKVVVDCSASAEAGGDEALKERALELLMAGDTAGAARMVAAFEASRSPRNVVVLPLTDADREQVRADEAAAEVWRVEERRAERNALLAACDWTQVPDAPLDFGLVEAWRGYRQELRDLDMGGVAFPEPPA